MKRDERTPFDSGATQLSDGTWELPAEEQDTEAVAPPQPEASERWTIHYHHGKEGKSVLEGPDLRLQPPIEVIPTSAYESLQAEVAEINGELLKAEPGMPSEIAPRIKRLRIKTERAQAAREKAEAEVERLKAELVRAEGRAAAELYARAESAEKQLAQAQEALNRVDAIANDPGLMNVGARAQIRKIVRSVLTPEQEERA